MARSTAQQRKQDVRAAARAAFAVGGLHGASVETIAATAGISQAYVFRLFGTKRALFLDVVIAAFDAMTEGMADAVGDATGVAALARMGDEYRGLLVDRERLLLQMQGFAACGDSEVRDAVRAAFERLWQQAAQASGLPPVQVKMFIAYGMLLDVSAALDASGLSTAWAADLTAPVPPAVYSFGEALGTGAAPA